MCYAHWNDMGGGFQKVKEYFVKRATRIFPTYWLVLIVFSLLYVCLKSYLVTPDPTSHLNTLNLTWGSFFKNIFLLNYPENPIVLVAWTMQFEILFYLVFASFMINVRLGVILLFCWFACIVLFNLGLIKTSFYCIKFVCDLYNGQLIFGCLIAYVLSKWRSQNLWMAIFILSVSCLGLIASGVLDVFSRNLSSSRCILILYSIFSFFIILGLVKVDVIKKISWPKILVTLGMASYPIYLTHHLTQSILFRLVHYMDFGGKDFLVVRYLISLSLIFLCSILIGYLFYKFYDLPVTSYIRKKLKKRKEKAKLDLFAQGLESERVF